MICVYVHVHVLLCSDEEKKKRERKIKGGKEGGRRYEKKTTSSKIKNIKHYMPLSQQIYTHTIVHVHVHTFEQYISCENRLLRPA